MKISELWLMGFDDAGVGVAFRIGILWFQSVGPSKTFRYGCFWLFPRWWWWYPIPLWNWKWEFSSRRMRKKLFSGINDRRVTYQSIFRLFVGIRLSKGFSKWEISSFHPLSQLSQPIPVTQPSGYGHCSSLTWKTKRICSVSEKWRGHGIGWTVDGDGGRIELNNLKGEIVRVGEIDELSAEESLRDCSSSSKELRWLIPKSMNSNW